MNIIYKCRHCGAKIGSIRSDHIEESTLGFDHLTDHERQEMIQSNQEGQIQVMAICEDCQETLDKYPEYHQWETFIQ
ncbi:DUF2757 family protein [Terrilactibacillus sp. BCM23-1]|uniref:DUF2757 family protein n=1 Tax=Terrilactibacillus tamarindi TaxID=2599694 RepID=A0A6N8CTI8_9BACI|nr:anti-sigma-F factor Fin family protein [Terrilactibacillus tamarindi]MTT32988.1 DUF2757 family protein [Terrilactibacillus tamarindi]